MNERILKNNYYKVGRHWKGYSAIDKLSSVTKIDKDDVKKWLEKQAICQIYLTPPQHVPRPHWTINKPNEIYQADLLFLSREKVGRKIYKYALVVIDVASRYKDAEPLTSKMSEEVAKAFEKIYSRKLSFPKTLIVDPGSECMGSVMPLMERRGTHIQRSEANNHRAQAFVERANMSLSEKIFSHQYAEEMLSANVRSRKWVKRLPAIMKVLNSSVTRLTGKEPLNAYKDEIVDVKPKTYSRPVGLQEKTIDALSKVRYLLAPGEEEGGNFRRATDPIWSTKVSFLKKSLVSKDQPVLYYLTDGPKRGFVREQLQVIPWNIELPPNFVKN